MKTEKYLQRIGTEQTDFVPNLDNLKHLQRRHLLNIPFENLDIHWKKPIDLSSESLYRKIVENRRGGFCYELNGLFFELLQNTGYESKRVSARVSDGKGNFGQEFDHLAIITRIEGEDYLVDVGFGDFFAEPIKFVLGEEQTDANGTFLIRKFDEKYFEVAKKNEESFISQYIFTLQERSLSEFGDMCLFHQTSPDSHFTQNKVCSLMHTGGRKTLTDKKFITTKATQKKEVAINSEEEFEEILEREFGIKPPVQFEPKNAVGRMTATRKSL
ncbi:MAG: arylamine N-acetyltransferase [Acidobacteriota bacterium]|nr:arylamine N-acetyltransferase [Acidobacteriota bacterium]